MSPVSDPLAESLDEECGCLTHPTKRIHLDRPEMEIFSMSLYYTFSRLIEEKLHLI